MVPNPQPHKTPPKENPTMTKYTVGRLVARCFPHVPHLPTHPVRLLQQRRILAAQLLVLLSLTCGDTSQVLPRASQAPPGDVLRAVAKGLSTDLVATPQGCSKKPEKKLGNPGDHGISWGRICQLSAVWAPGTSGSWMLLGVWKGILDGAMFHRERVTSPTPFKVLVKIPSHRRPKYLCPPWLGRTQIISLAV